MRWFSFLVLSFASSAARAEPCDIAIVHAPPAVAAEIAAWMTGEPSCSRPLQVRAVETADGLYVVAQEPSGRLHERVVPDAKTAAVLVASWAADDGAAPSPPPPAIVQVVVPPLATVTVATAPLPPPSVPVVAERWRPVLDVVAAATVVERGGTTVQLGIDALRLGPVRFGAAAAYTTTDWQTDQPGYRLKTTSLDAFVRAAVDHTWGRFAMRGELAFGVEQMSDVMTSQSGVSDVFQASWTIGGWLTPAWRLRCGPVVTTVPKAYFDDGVLGGGFDLRLLVGVDRRL